MQAPSSLLLKTSCLLLPLPGHLSPTGFTEEEGEVSDQEASVSTQGPGSTALKVTELERECQGCQVINGTASST